MEANLNAQVGNTTGLAAQDYVQKIREAWTNSREAIFEVGNQLLIAKEDLPHGEFEPMIENDLPFGKSTAEKYTKIANCDYFKDNAVVKCLPASWGTLYELQKLDADLFRDALDNGEIHTDMTRTDVFEIKAKRDRAKARETAAAKIEEYEGGCSIDDLDRIQEPLSVIYADPPWKYHDSQVDYPTMSTKEICSLPVNEKIGDKAQLFMWVTSNTLVDGLKVMQSWGFNYKSQFVWVKPNRKNGLGMYWANSHEILLLGVKGNAPFAATDVESFLMKDATENSRKPSEVGEMIEKVSLEGSRLELFARETSAGWIAWGNDVPVEQFDASLGADELPVAA